MANVAERAADERAKELLKALGPDVEEMINLASRDLHSGPVYLTEDGDVASPFDEDVTRFDFPGTVDKLGEIFDALDGLMTFYVDEDGFTYDTDPQDDDDNWEEDEDDEDEMIYVGPSRYYIVERDDVIRAMVGKELAGYI